MFSSAGCSNKHPDNIDLSQLKIPTKDGSQPILRTRISGLRFARPSILPGIQYDFSGTKILVPSSGYQCSWFSTKDNLRGGASHNLNRGAWRAASPRQGVCGCGSPPRTARDLGAAAPSKHNLLDATPDPLIFWERVKLVHPLLDKVFRRFGTLDDAS